MDLPLEVPCELQRWMLRPLPCTVVNRVTAEENPGVSDADGPAGGLADLSAAQKAPSCIMDRAATNQGYPRCVKRAAN